MLNAGLRVALAVEAAHDRGLCAARRPGAGIGGGRVKPRDHWRSARQGVRAGQRRAGRAAPHGRRLFFGRVGLAGSVSLGVRFVCFRSHLLSGHVLSEIVGAMEGLLAAFVSTDIGLLGLVAQFMASTVFRAGENLSPVRNPS